MKKKVKIILLAVIVLLIITWFFPDVQLLYFNSSNSSKIGADHKLYNKDVITLRDTLLSWGKFPQSPLAFEFEDWWVDTVLYNEQKDKILYIVDVITSERSEMPYNQSQWILGFRRNGKLNFYMSEGSQLVFYINNSVKTRKKISYKGRRFLVEKLYYPFTFSYRKEFWSELTSHEDLIIDIQEREMKKWKSIKK